MNTLKQNIKAPKLIYNSVRDNIKVIQELENSFNICDSFALSVAFVSDSGLSALKQTLLDIIGKGKKGRIVTSTYLGFNSPKVFRSLFNLFKGTNVEVRIYKKDGFHPKGYLFNIEDECSIMIGSSNLTQDALGVNQEWNICLNSYKDEEIVNKVKSEFEQQWSESDPITEEWIETYAQDYQQPIYYVGKQYRGVFEPNKMQTEALVCLDDMRKSGKNKALLISATGTGKTYLSAFDVKQFNAEKMLFVVHRETIARKSKESFEDIIKNKKMGMFTGTQKDDDCDYLFSTISTIGKKEYLSRFDPKEFDYIVIDEVHRAGAEMYRVLLEYFKPKFLLGMSATPERTDKPEKIYELFDYNIAYEIRLKQAMEYDLLCPFHYFGISDLVVDGNVIDDKTSFSKLVSMNRVNHILDAINKYDYSGEKPHGLIFVSRKEEAIELSKLFNEHSQYRTKALTGNDSDEARRNAISLLENEDTRRDYLDFIFTVDIFNEGVDIPCVNLVLMLRPTESAIIFVQQLGRGLRKSKGKEYVNVIDFIGNYTNNFMIPIALSGSLKYNKDELRRFMYEKNVILPGASTISFDEVTKDRIYKSIDTAKFQSIEIIKDAYQKLKARLANTIPTMIDFDKYESIDPDLIIKKLGSYHAFLSKYEDDYKNELDDLSERYLEFLSTRFATGKRVLELELIRQLAIYRKDAFSNLKKSMIYNFGSEFKDKTKQTIINELTGKFEVGPAKQKYKDVIFIEKDGDDYKISEVFDGLLKNKQFKEMVDQIIEFGINRYNTFYKNTYKDTDLVLYQKYSYDDVFRLLNWETAEVSLNVGGYKYDKFSNTFPVFINYDKENAALGIKYGDVFKNKKEITAISKHPRTKESTDAKLISNSKKNNIAIHMFMKKNKDDGEAKEFYYLGLVSKNGDLVDSQMETGENVFEIPYEFETEIRDDVFSYITNA